MKFLRLDTREGGVEQRALEVIRNIRHPPPARYPVRHPGRRLPGDRHAAVRPEPDGPAQAPARRSGQPGVPRNELLGYMDELARAVDYLNEPRHQAGMGAWSGSSIATSSRTTSSWSAARCGWPTSGWRRSWRPPSPATQGSMSPYYVAPEVIQGQFSRWSDQYSLAVTYCQLRTGRPPFEGDSAIQVIYAHVHTRPRPVGPARGGASGRRPRPGEAARAALADLPRVRARPGPSGAGGRPAHVRPRRKSRGAAGRGRDEAPRDAGAAAHPPHLGRPRVFARCGRGDGVAGSAASAWRAWRSSSFCCWWRWSSSRVLAHRGTKLLGGSQLIGMKLVLIPPGEFLMGSSKDLDKDADADELPQHRVRITRPFYLGVTEVTQGQYRTVTGQNPSNFKRSDDMPVEHVGWLDAINFCNAVSRAGGPHSLLPGRRSKRLGA